MIPLVVYVAALVLVFSWVSSLAVPKTNAIPYSEVVGLFQQEQVKSFTVKGNTITLELRTPYNGKTQIQTERAQPESFRQEMEELLKEQYASGVLTSYDFQPGKAFSAYDIVLPIILAGGVLLLLWSILMGKMNGSNPLANFGKARSA